MGVRFINKFRKRNYDSEIHWNNFLNIKPLPFKIVVKRFNDLNNCNFKSELWFMNFLNLKGLRKPLEVRRNFPILNRFFADFFILDLNVVIEIDGKSHDDSKEYDDKRDKLFESRNLKIYRIKYLDEITAKKVIKELNEIISEKQKKIIKNKSNKKKFYKKRNNLVQSEMNKMMLAALSPKIIIRKKTI